MGGIDNRDKLLAIKGEVERRGYHKFGIRIFILCRCFKMVNLCKCRFWIGVEGDKCLYMKGGKTIGVTRCNLAYTKQKRNGNKISFHALCRVNR